MKHPYFQSCVDFDGGNFEQMDWLHHVIDRSREITLNTFQKHVATDCFATLKSRLGYAVRGGRHQKAISLARDWHVRYFRSKTPDGKPCVFLKWSAIEFIFTSDQPMF